MSTSCAAMSSPFPFGTGHQLGAGTGGSTITPTRLLPPKPWREVPILHHGIGQERVRLLCGYLQCDILNFRPLRDTLPTLLHVRTQSDADSAWLQATIDQITAEVDRPRSGGLSMLERLTEITFIELLRHEIMAAPPGSTGWLAALGEPALGRCLSLIHDDPEKSWTVETLARWVRPLEKHADRALRCRPQNLADQLFARLASLSGERRT